MSGCSSRYLWLKQILTSVMKTPALISFQNNKIGIVERLAKRDGWRWTDGERN